MLITSIDLGTTNVKVALIKFYEDGRVEVVRSLSQRVNPVQPEVNSYEHDPRDIKKQIKTLVKGCVGGVHPDAIVLTSYLFGLLLTDEGMNYLTNIITWMDERPYEVLNEVMPYSKELYFRTGCPPLHIYGLPKIIWFKKRLGSGFKRVRYLMDSKAFLMNFLTGEYVTDLSTASGTYQLLNLRTLKWDELGLTIAGIDEKSLPELREGYYVGMLRRGLKEELGLSDDVPVVLGLFDGASMIYGATGGLSGLGVVNLGSSAMIRAVTSEAIVDPSPLMMFQTYYFIDKTWLGGGAINNAGVVVEYIIKLLYDVDPQDTIKYSNVLESLNNTVKKTKTLISIPLLYPERLPFIKPTKRLSILGIDSSSRKEDVAISVIEGVLMLLALIYSSMEGVGVSVNEVRVGGKLSEYYFIRKLLANILGRKVVHTTVGDLSHIGNIFLALRALKHVTQKGIYELCESITSSAERISPIENEVTYYRSLLREFKDLINKLYT
jgi:gluconokinase